MPASVVADVQLKSCPFCGSSAQLKADAHYAGTYYWAKCESDECGVSTRAQHGQEHAAKLWNTRA